MKAQYNHNYKQAFCCRFYGRGSCSRCHCRMTNCANTFFSGYNVQIRLSGWTGLLGFATVPTPVSSTVGYVAYSMWLSRGSALPCPLMIPVYWSTHLPCVRPMCVCAPNSQSQRWRGHATPGPSCGSTKWYMYSHFPWESLWDQIQTSDG